jgi:hypothetical protein
VQDETNNVSLCVASNLEPEDGTSEFYSNAIPRERDGAPLAPNDDEKNKSIKGSLF